MTRGPIGLYIHVPFCRAKCSWCAFCSVEGTGKTEAWLQRILVQLELTSASWATVYIGGGTPSVLSPEQLDRLLTAVALCRIPDSEATVEANPESLTAGHLEVLEKHEVSRLSLGIQSYQEDILQRHGRPTRRHHLDQARRMVRSWSGSLSLDLICGLAGQTEAGQRYDLEQALDWNPDHISFYSLTLEDGTPLAHSLRTGQCRLPDEDDADSWWHEGVRFLENAGLRQYEVSNFSRPGRESVHNQRYWNLEPWLGLGPSAVSLLPGEGGFEYWTETENLGEWLKGRPATVERPTPLEFAKDQLLSGLRQRGGVPSTPWLSLLPQTLEKWRGRVLVEKDRLFLSREAFLFLDAFLRQAFAELDERPEFR